MKKQSIIAIILTGIILFAAGFGTSYLIPDKDKTITNSETTVQNTAQENNPEQPSSAEQEQSNPANAKNPDYEFLVASAAWQMSAEAHALMMQGFNIAKENIDEIKVLAQNDQNGYSYINENGKQNLYKDGKRVAVVCDIDDTLVDGVHYTANILGKDGEWTNKAFTDFIQSEGCTSLPGAVDFANYCIENGIALFYVTNRYDQGYKTGEDGYSGEEGYVKADGTVIGSSTFDIFGMTMYDITMKSMSALGFPTNDTKNDNFSPDAILIVNDTKLNGSSKEGIRDAIENGDTISSGERADESTKYPESISLASHHIEMLLGDDLNDISGIFSAAEESAVSRVELTIENMDKWGTKWIVFPNSVYGSSINFASAYGYTELFNTFDYTVSDNEIWNIYD